MNAISPLRLALVLGLTGALTVACNKSSGSTTAGTTGGAKVNPADAEPLQQKRASITYALFPADADTVIGFSGANIRRSKLVMSNLSMLTRPVQAPLDRLKACGIDVVNQLDTIVVAINQKTEGGLAVVRGFTAGDLTQCVTRASKSGVSMRQEGDLQVFEQNGKTFYVAWLDSNTAVFSPQKPAVTAALTGDGGLDKSAEMTGLLDKVDTSAGFYFAMKMPANKASTPLGTINGAFGSLFLDSGLKLRGGAAMPDATTAANASKMINSQIGALGQGPFAPFLANLTIQGNGPDLAVDLSLSEDQLSKLVEMIKTNPLFQMLLQRATGGSAPLNITP